MAYASAKSGRRILTGPIEKSMGIKWPLGISRHKGRKCYKAIRNYLEPGWKRIVKEYGVLTPSQIERSNPLGEASDDLFSVCGPHLWPNDERHSSACPDWLADATADNLGGNCPSNLFYAVPNDRVKIRRHFRRWIIAKCIHHRSNRYTSSGQRRGRIRQASVQSSVEFEVSRRGSTLSEQSSLKMHDDSSNMVDFDKHSDSYRSSSEELEMFTMPADHQHGNELLPTDRNKTTQPQSTECSMTENASNNTDAHQASVCTSAWAANGRATCDHTSAKRPSRIVVLKLPSHKLATIVSRPSDWSCFSENQRSTDLEALFPSPLLSPNAPMRGSRSRSLGSSHPATPRTTAVAPEYPGGVANDDTDDPFGGNSAADSTTSNRIRAFPQSNRDIKELTNILLETTTTFEDFIASIQTQLRAQQRPRQFSAVLLEGNRPGGTFRWRISNDESGPTQYRLLLHGLEMARPNLQQRGAMCPEFVAIVEW